MGQRFLRRDDIIGKQVINVYESAPYIEPDGYGGCEVYVQLQDDIVISLVAQDSFVELPIPRLDKRSLASARQAGNHVLQICANQTVMEVLTSEYWPSFGLLLDNHVFLLSSDDFTPQVVGVCAVRVGDGYDLSDVATYWGHKRLS